jgi:hypothetical protein
VVTPLSKSASTQIKSMYAVHGVPLKGHLVQAKL